MPYKAFNKDFTCKGKKYAENTTYEGSDKCATNKLHIKAKLGLKGFIKACVDFTLKKTKIENVNSDVENKSSGDFAKIGSSGDSAKITSEGGNSVVMAAGYNCVGSHLLSG